MADRENPFAQTFEELDRESIRKYDAKRKAMLEREELLNRQYTWRGNRVAPMSIEPFAMERQRLDGMTDADRALRKQWIADQMLAPNEPRYVPELFPKNPIRRVMGIPWDTVFKALQPVLGEKRAAAGRYFVPRVALAFAVVWGAYYNVRYNPNNWIHQQGFNVYSNRPTLLPDDPDWPNAPLKKEFGDRGFANRTVFKEL